MIGSSHQLLQVARASLRTRELLVEYKSQCVKEREPSRSLTRLWQISVSLISVCIYRCIVCVVWTHITTLATMNFCTFWFEELFSIYTCHPSFNIFLFRSFYFMLKVRLVLLVVFLSFWLTQFCKYMLL